VYARVSSADQTADLDRQVTRVTAWATTERIPVDKVVVEVGSALNGHRRKFFALLRDPWVHGIVVEHRDRFCRFGSEYVRLRWPLRVESWWWWIPLRSMTTWWGT
jgi:predicted site-specific integrase-resolvase